MTSHQRSSIAFSQNFLRSPQLVEHLLRGSTIGPSDLVLEIGPGTGRITEALSRRAGKVVAVERDAELARALRGRLAAYPNVDVREADFLAFPLPRAPYKVFANIPFNATAEIVRTLTEAKNPPLDAYLVVQAEAAERYAGAERESLASVLLKPWWEPTLPYRFERADFAPAPRVDVVMLRLRKRGPPLVAGRHGQLYRDLAAHAFTAGGPTLRSALGDVLSAAQLRQLGGGLGFSPNTAPADLRFEQWLALFLYLTAVAEGRLRRAVSGAEGRLRERQAGLPKVHRTRTTDHRPR